LKNKEKKIQEVVKIKGSQTAKIDGKKIELLTIEDLASIDIEVIE